MSDPTGPAGNPYPGPTPCHPTTGAATPDAAAQGPLSLGGGPALDGWDSELEEAVRFAPRIGSL